MPIQTQCSIYDTLSLVVLEVRIHRKQEQPLTYRNNTETRQLSDSSHSSQNGVRIMLDLFTIFSKGGIVLWCFQGTCQSFTLPVNELIRSVILQVSLKGIKLLSCWPCIHEFLLMFMYESCLNYYFFYLSRSVVGVIPSLMAH